MKEEKTDWSKYFTYSDGELFHRVRTEGTCTSPYGRGMFNSRFAGKLAGRVSHQGRVQVTFEKRTHLVHRIIWEMFNGAILSGMEIDHKDRNPLNNRIENLRLATPSQNRANIGKLRGTLPRGVRSHGKGFQATINRGGRKVCLGTYPTPEEAREVYASKGKEFYGEFFCEG